MSVGRNTATPSAWTDIHLAPHAPAAAVQVLRRAARGHHPLPTHLCNAYTLTLANRDERLARVLRRPGALNLLDGVPVRWVLQLAGVPDVSSTRGPTLFRMAVDELGSDVRQVFLGGTEEAAEAMRRRLLSAGVITDGAAVISPPFEAMSSEVLERYVSTISALRPDIVWVGLGTPKQDYVVDHLARELSVPAVAVGAAFDFYAGTVREAPAFLRDTGLEWTFRLATEPGRLWRRYLIGNAAFLRAAVPVIRAGRRRRALTVGPDAC